MKAIADPYDDVSISKPAVDTIYAVVNSFHNYDITKPKDVVLPDDTKFHKKALCCFDDILTNSSNVLVTQSAAFAMAVVGNLLGNDIKNLVVGRMSNIVLKTSSPEVQKATLSAMNYIIVNNLYDDKLQ